jgi:ribosomal protein S18 acetylase RimI-like enzyme
MATPGETAAATLSDTITYLEMTAPPPRKSHPVPAAKLALLRAERCSPAYYRFLYNGVGENWLWFERRLWSDERLAERLARDEVEVSVLYVGGVPAGYFELEHAANGETELCYFGLMPDFIGRRLGSYFLRAAVESAWLGATRRVWVHTSTYDHARALGLYQRVGFRVYERRRLQFPDPRLSGILPRALQHPLLPPLPA